MKPILIAFVGVACVFSCLALKPAGGLRELAQKRGLTLGTAVPVRLLREDADGGKYREATVANFNLIELENEFKPPAVWTGPREYKFTDTDYVLGEPGKDGWAQRNNLKVRGHVLVYASDNGYTLPKWLKDSEKDLSKEQASQLLHDYILAVAGRYRGKIAMWDVVNEAIDDRPNTNPFNLRDSLWFRKLGPEFLVLAFKWAREADPKAELYYNDYGIESGGRKGQNALDLAKWLKEQGAPITGVGLQYHLVAKMTVEPGDGHYQYLEAIEKLGLDHMVTELDVAVQAKPAPAGDPTRGMLAEDPADLDRQAKVYADVFQMVLQSKRSRGINIWGLTDGYSWIPGFSQGRNGLATLFYKDYSAKPAYRAVESVLSGATK